MPNYSTPWLQDIARQAAAQYGVPESLFLWQINQESTWDPHAYNSNHGGIPAIGIAQFQPATARQYGVDSYDPISSLYGAAHYDSDLYHRYGNWNSALTHYGTIHNAQTSADAQSALGGAGNPAPSFTDFSSFSEYSDAFGKWAQDFSKYTPFGVVGYGASATASAVEGYGQRIAIAVLGVGLILIGGIMLALGTESAQTALAFAKDKLATAATVAAVA